MNRRQQFGLFASVMGATILFAFNNCSNVKFSPESKLLTSEMSSDLQSTGDQDAAGMAPIDDVPLSEEQINLIVDTLPQEVVEAPPVPVDAVVDDPSIFDKFLCPNNTDKALICHVSGGNEYLCVGRSAIESHFEHVATGEAGTVKDYFGPCRK